MIGDRPLPSSAGGERPGPAGWGPRCDLAASSLPRRNGEPCISPGGTKRPGPGEGRGASLRRSAEDNPWLPGSSHGGCRIGGHADPTGKVPKGSHRCRWRIHWHVVPGQGRDAPCCPNLGRLCCAVARGGPWSDWTSGASPQRRPPTLCRAPRLDRPHHNQPNRPVTGGCEPASHLLDDIALTR